jgi:hypothetical protein
MPITWEKLNEFANEEALPPRSLEVQEYMDSVPEFVREQRRKFVSKTMDLHDTYEEPNPYPFDLEPEILQSVIWHRAGKRAKKAYDPADEEIKILDPYKSFVTYAGIEVACTYLFTKPSEFNPSSDKQPKFFCHRTSIEKLERIMATKIGDKSGFLLTDFSMHELGISRDFSGDYSDIQKNEISPLKRFDFQYNGIYFAPFFPGDGTFVDDKSVVIIVSSDIVFMTKKLAL